MPQPHQREPRERQTDPETRNTPSAGRGCLFQSCFPTQSSASPGRRNKTASDLTHPRETPAAPSHLRKQPPTAAPVRPRPPRHPAVPAAHPRLLAAFSHPPGTHLERSDQFLLLKDIAASRVSKSPQNLHWHPGRGAGGPTGICAARGGRDSLQGYFPVHLYPACNPFTTTQHHMVSYLP